MVYLLLQIALRYTFSLSDAYSWADIEPIKRHSINEMKRGWLDLTRNSWGNAQ